MLLSRCVTRTSIISSFAMNRNFALNMLMFVMLMLFLLSVIFVLNLLFVLFCVLGVSVNCMYLFDSSYVFARATNDNSSRARLLFVFVLILFLCCDSVLFCGVVCFVVMLMRCCIVVVWLFSYVYGATNFFASSFCEDMYDDDV